MIFLSSSNDKEVDVKCDGQGNALGDFAGRTGTVSEDAGPWARLRQALSSPWRNAESAINIFWSWPEGAGRNQTHHRLIADFLKARGMEVTHIIDRQKTHPHPFTSAARIVDDALSYAPCQRHEFAPHQRRDL